ncbi:MAG: GTPase HflX [Thermoplasmata archaeon]
MGTVLSRASNCAIIAIKDETEETEELCKTLDIEIVERLIQRRKKPHPQTFLGPGKLDEIRERVSGVDLVVIDGELTPSQHFRLETSLRRMCVDRIGLVLEIFDRHAGSAEAKAQIALARIRYELPFLREWVSKALSDDRPGFMSGGEYAIDAYYENARRQMKKIEKELERIAEEREARRSRRKSKGFFLVSICGYTNSGKSTLLNSLSGAQTVVDNRLFSTLSTTTRKILNVKAKILLTDTVGFIKNLPPNLIDAFDATMEEIYVSDCVLLVIDASDPVETIKVKFETSIDFLVSRVPKDRIVVVLNKIDRVTSSDLNLKLPFFNNLFSGYVYYVISALTKQGLNKIVNEILDRMNLLDDETIELPNTEKGRVLYQWIAERAIITDAIWGDKIILKVRLTQDELEIIQGKLSALKEADKS